MLEEIGRKARAVTSLIRGYVRTRRWGVRIDRGVKLAGPGTYDLHPGCAIRRDTGVYVGPGATFTLMPGASIGSDSKVNVVTGLRIGEGTRISWRCQITDSDFHTLVRIDGSPKEMNRPVTIGRGVLVGAGAIILKGNQIGDHTAVASGAVLFGGRDPWPAGSIIGGNPATVMGEISRIDF